MIKKEKSNIAKVKKRYEKYIDSNNNINNLSHSVDTFRIRRGLLLDLNDPHIQEHGLQGDEN
jgi:hypothetical protein